MQEVSEFKLNSDKPKNAGKWLEEIKEINIDPKKAIPIKNILDLTPESEKNGNK